MPASPIASSHSRIVPPGVWATVLQRPLPVGLLAVALPERDLRGQRADENVDDTTRGQPGPASIAEGRARGHPVARAFTLAP